MYRLMQLTLAVLLVGAALVGPASAAPIGAPASDTTITTCDELHFDSAVADGGNITFDCGSAATILLHNPVTISKDTTIDGGGVITLTGNLTTELLTVGTTVNVSLQNIVLDKGYGHNLGGGAIINAGHLSLDHVTIQNSLADFNGGAINATGPMTIRDSLFKNNSSAKTGGAIYEQNPVAVTIDNSSFSGNTAQDASTGVGGAIALGNGAQMTVTGGSFYNNLAVLDGGALDLSANAAASFLPGASGGTAFSLNFAKGYGGAISNNGGVLNLFDADLSFNQTLTDTLLIGFGGAIDDEGAMSVVNSNFNTNAGRFGGAVFVGGNLFPASATIVHSHFIANSAAQSGGALYVNTLTTTVAITDTSIEFNRAGLGGGGIARFNAHLSIAKSSLTSNAAPNGGGLATDAGPLGGPHPTTGPYVEVHDSTIASNLSTNSAGGGIENSGLLDLVNVTLAYNHKTGLYMGADPSIITRLQSTVLDNPGAPNCSGDPGSNPPTSAGNNLSADDSNCGLSVGNHDHSGADSRLGDLTKDPHGITYYIPPLQFSLLLGNGGGGCAASDQRYALRFFACDIGAIELEGLLAQLWLPLVRH